MNLEIHYDEGSSTATYRATVDDSAFSAFEAGTTEWLVVATLARWDASEGECVPVSTGTGEPIGPARLHKARIVRVNQVGELTAAHGVARSQFAPSLRRRVEAFFDSHLDQTSLIHESFAVSDLVNYDLAIQHLIANSSGEQHTLGFSTTAGESDILRTIVSERGSESQTRVQPVKQVQCPSGPDERRTCVEQGVFLVETRHGRVAIAVTKPTFSYDQSMTLEVLALDNATTVAVMEDLRAAKTRLNVFRGQVVALTNCEMGRASIEFRSLKYPKRDDLVLPEGTLELIHRQAMMPVRHRDLLIERGFSTRHGLLLYGPPGTGKTLTVRYLLGQLDGHTRILVGGKCLESISLAYELARTLSPSVVVLEDVDLIAGEREQNMHASQLHDLLEELDGVARHEDLTTLLTTNRHELLEQALAQRPGRVDQAIKIGLPAASERRRLFERFSRSMPLHLDLEPFVTQTMGASGAFIEELLRRTQIISASADAATVQAEHMQAALEELLESGNGMTKTITGFQTPKDDAPND